jgi:hypothetical protein
MELERLASYLEGTDMVLILGQYNPTLDWVLKMDVSVSENKIIPQPKQSGQDINSSPAENNFTALLLHKHVAICVSFSELSLLYVPPISPFWT